MNQARARYADRVSTEFEGFLGEGEKAYLFERRRLNLIKNFKRRVVGLCPTIKVRSLDEIARAALDLGLVDSLEAGKEEVRSFVKSGERLDYAPGKGMTFEEVRDSKGNVAYRVMVELF